MGLFPPIIIKLKHVFLGFIFYENMCVPECLSGTTAGGDVPYEVMALMLIALISDGTGTELDAGPESTSCFCSFPRKILYCCTTPL